jgi:hypothetical protein
VLSEGPVGAAAVPDAWIRNGQERMNGSSCVKRSPERFRKGAGGQGWLPAVLGKTRRTE